MSMWLIIIIGFVYTAVAIDLYTKGNVPLAIAFTGYAFSHIGLAWAAKI